MFLRVVPVERSSEELWATLVRSKPLWVECSNSKLQAYHVTGGSTGSVAIYGKKIAIWATNEEPGQSFLQVVVK